MRFNRFDLNLLVVLDALLEERSVTKAADRLNVSQSAISGMLGRLRDYFNDDILVQVGRSMEPTSLARQLAAPVRNLLLQAQATVTLRPAFDPAAEVRQIKIMASDYSTSILLQRAIPDIVAQAPNLTVDVLPHTEDANEKLRRGEADFLIIPEKFLTEDFPHESMFNDTWCCIVWNDNQLVGDRFDLETFRAARHVATMLGRPRFPTFEEFFFREQNIVRKIALTCSDFTSLGGLVVGTPLVATVHRRLAERFIRYLPVRIVEPPVDMPQLTECMQWHHYHESDPCHTWVRTVLRSAAQSLPPLLA